MKTTLKIMSKSFRIFALGAGLAAVLYFGFATATKPTDSRTALRAVPQVLVSDGTESHGGKNPPRG